MVRSSTKLIDLSCLAQLLTTSNSVTRKTIVVDVSICVPKILRSENRSKQDNIILIGIIPGGKEALNDRIHCYMDPLVDDLLDIYTGCTMSNLEQPEVTTVYIVLLAAYLKYPCLLCKIGGFLLYRSARACNKQVQH